MTSTTRGHRFGMVICLCLTVWLGCKGEGDGVEKGGEGESCTRRDDCTGSLLCIDNRCVAPAGAAPSGSDGGAGMVVETRGQAGESCTKRADCQTMLACVDQVCVAESTLTTTPLQVRGERGESCEARNDCLDGLACVGERCREADYSVTVQTKECFRVQCEKTADCCENFMPSTSCPSWKSLCDGGDPSYCSIYESNCMCGLACEDDLCVTANTCTMDLDCGSSLLKCVGMKCVQCEVKADCADPEASCVEGVCKAGCKKNEDCPLFSACQSGKCVETGCMSDRECLFATDDPLSKCIDKECVIPCMNDTECTMPFHACESSKCVFVGCESHEECRVLLGLHNGLFGVNDKAVCRAPTP